MKHVFIIGSRGYHENYGGWETFVTNLIDNYKDSNTLFYVPELTFSNNTKDRIENGVRIHPIYVPPQGNATMLTFAIKAVLYYKKYIKKNNLNNVIMYILGCRVGPLFTFIHKSLQKQGVKIIINPDGLEWTRDKWNYLIKKYFKLSERTMVKSSNVVVSDSKAIKKYIDEKYHVDSIYIAYGAYLKENKKINIDDFYKKNNISNNYYLFVGRFVPENNIEFIIKEYMKTKIKKDLVIVSNVEKNKFYNELVKNTNFLSDSRIKFVGGIYDERLLRQIRINATAYIHGHSAGGTNPSLLEALSTTNINILYDVVYNREVGSDKVFYFTKEDDSLKNVINQVENLSSDEVIEYGKLAKERIKNNYTWDIVANKYQELFKRLLNDKK